MRLTQLGATFALVLSAGFPTTASAQEFDGWCFDGGECTGTVAISGDMFPTCEENCDMKNKTQVLGMDAYLYEADCRGDSGSYSFRVMFVRFQSPHSEEQGMMVTPDSATPIFRCQ